jgi:hypothetical protein
MLNTFGRSCSSSVAVFPACLASSKVFCARSRSWICAHLVADRHAQAVHRRARAGREDVARVDRAPAVVRVDLRDADVRDHARDGDVDVGGFEREAVDERIAAFDEEVRRERLAALGFAAAGRQRRGEARGEREREREGRASEAEHRVS